MIIFPAIDIRGGKCVRLTEGRYDLETVFADNPLKMAKQWEEQGAEYLHLVDLDGALAGNSVNFPLIQSIAKSLQIPVQVGGGIRTMADIDKMLAAGVARVILGSVAVKQPELVAKACEQYQDKIVVGIDARDGKVAVQGWTVSGEMDAADLAVQMKAIGVQRVIFTDISRDGKLSGVNAEASVALAQTANIRVIASGGVNSINDILKLSRLQQQGIEGVIIGKALYCKTMTLSEAIRAAQTR